MAAVLSDSLLYDGLQRKLRENVLIPGDFGRAYPGSAVDVLFEPEDIAVAFVLLHLLEERSEIVIRNYSSYGSWPDSTLPRTSRLPERIQHLRRAGMFDVAVEGSEARVSYGPEIQRICARLGIELAEPRTEKEEAAAAS
jgi:hypothetical protein